MQLGEICVARRLFRDARVWSSGNRLKCPSLPMLDSRLMVDTSAVVIMVIMSADQAEYLLTGREMISQQKSHF